MRKDLLPEDPTLLRFPPWLHECDLSL
jgi:hypothetical protein